MQEDHDCVYCVVDQHAITVEHDPAELLPPYPSRPRPSTWRPASTPNAVVLFVQSQVPEHSQLQWVLALPHRLR